MKREALPILQMARRGDPDAMHQVGRGYLRGLPPFGSHPDAGVRYLVRAADAGSIDALASLAETLSLEDLVRLRLLPQLRQGAARGVHVAEFKLGLWLVTQPDGHTTGLYWLRRAAASGLPQARIALAEAIAQESVPTATNQAIRLLRAECLAGNERAWTPLAQAALDAGDAALFHRALENACRLPFGCDGALSALLIDALALESQGTIAPVRCPALLLRAALARQADNGDARAMLFLGRALCGLDESLRHRADLPSSRNLRNGLTLLTSAANAGECEAWLALAHVYGSRPRLPYAAASHRYCLERAASRGSVAAAIQLGRLLLEVACTAQELQRAMELLWPPAKSGNTTARALLEGLVLPVAGNPEVARSAIVLVSGRNPLLASRLSLARAFGLTRHEALTVDVRRAVRVWGLWVDASGFFTQRRKATPRAVPITSPGAEQALQEAKATFATVDAGTLGPEGNYRTRVYAMRAAFEQLKLSERLFFAEAARADVGTIRKRRRLATSPAGALALGLR